MKLMLCLAIMMCGLLITVVAGESVQDVSTQDAQLYQQLFVLRDSIQEQQYTEVETIFLAGKGMEKRRNRVCESKALGLLRLQIQNIGSESSIDTNYFAILRDVRNTSVLYKCGNTVSRAAKEEEQRSLSNVGMSDKYDNAQYDIYHLCEQAIDGVSIVSFALYDKRADRSCWKREWLSRATGFLYRKELYKENSLVVTDRQDIKINQGLTEEFLRHGFEGEKFPTNTMEALIMNTHTVN